MFTNLVFLTARTFVFVKVSKKAWWRLWDNNDAAIDLEVYGRGLMSLLDLERWCTFQCDVTLNQLKYNHEKKTNFNISV